MRPTIFITGTIDEGGIDIQRVTEHRRLSYTSNPYLLYTTDDEIQSISQEEEIHIRLPKNFQRRRRINKTWSNRTLGKNIKNRIHFSIDYHLR